MTIQLCLWFVLNISTPTIKDWCYQIRQLGLVLPATLKNHFYIFKCMHYDSTWYALSNWRMSLVSKHYIKIYNIYVIVEMIPPNHARYILSKCKNDTTQSCMYSCFWFWFFYKFGLPISICLSWKHVSQTRGSRLWVQFFSSTLVTSSNLKKSLTSLPFR